MRTYTGWKRCGDQPNIPQFYKNQNQINKSLETYEFLKANAYRNIRSPMKPRNGKRWNYVKQIEKIPMVVVYMKYR